MDQDTLVVETIDAGEKLVAALIASGFDVLAAGWIKEDEGGQWYLYIVSPLVDAPGPTAAYRKLNPIYKDLVDKGPLPIDLFDIKLVSPNDAIGKALVEFAPKHAGPLISGYRRPYLGGVPIQEARLYPLVPQA
ncbi:MAG: hypothetical protein U0746_10840 [Gemmataceae bacterium]